MEWNTETQRHRALFFERTEFTEYFRNPFLIDYKAYSNSTQAYYKHD